MKPHTPGQLVFLLQTMAEGWVHSYQRREEGFTHLTEVTGPSAQECAHLSG